MSPKSRRLLLSDLVPRFEADPSSTHVRNAIATIERLGDEGRRLWRGEPKRLARWMKGCTEIRTAINRLGERRHVKKQELATALREFIQEFEHYSDRILQMLADESEHEIDRISRWLDFVYRCATYALISYWIDDKLEEKVTRITMTIDATTGASRVEQETESLLKQVWVGMAPVRCRPSQKTPAFAGSASPRAPRSSGPRADYSSRVRREVVDGRDAPVQAGPQGP